MSIPIVKLKFDGENIHSPFSGKPAFTKNHEPNRRDPNLLFVYLGSIGEWEYVSQRVKGAFPKGSPEELQPQSVCRRLSIPGAVCLEVNAGWNGVNWVAWAAPEAE